MKSNATISASRRGDIASEASATRRLVGLAALMVAHCAGMLDLVALPVWVGTLTTAYKLDPQRAGGLVTCFLAGVVLSSCYFAPRLNRIRHRVAIPVGYGIATVAFGGCAISDGYQTLIGLHVVAGLAIGCSLSLTHGVIGVSRNPHRLFALVGLALGIFAIAFLATIPVAIAQHGGNTLFKAFAVVMLVAASVTAIAFPSSTADRAATVKSATRLSITVWLGMVGVSCMALNQAMVFGFVMRIGLDRGFGFAAVASVLIALGVVNLFPAPLAAVLQRKISARTALVVGPLVQAGVAFTISNSSAFGPYATATAVFAAVMIFTHTFAFGTLAKNDKSGRAAAATPVMLMTGAAIGPILGGTLVKTLGYGSLGAVSMAIGIVAMACFSRTANLRDITVSTTP